MNINIKLDEKEIRQAIADYVAKRAGITILPGSVTVQVKSKQNYRSEWEQANIRCDFQAVQE